VYVPVGAVCGTTDQLVPSQCVIVRPTAQQLALPVQAILLLVPPDRGRVLLDRRKDR